VKNLLVVFLVGLFAMIPQTAAQAMPDGRVGPTTATGTPPQRLS